MTGVRDRRPGERYDVVLPDGVLVPGLVDMQINGCFGVDFAAAAPGDWSVVAARMPETGVTAFAPTFITAPVAELAASLRRLAEVHAAPPSGSRVLGAHVEGPFLSEVRRGAHNPVYLCDPTRDAVEALIDAGPPGTACGGDAGARTRRTPSRRSSS